MKLPATVVLMLLGLPEYKSRATKIIDLKDAKQSKYQLISSHFHHDTFKEHLKKFFKCILLS